jgi:hypothetical protein
MNVDPYLPYPYPLNHPLWIGTYLSIVIFISYCIALVFCHHCFFNFIVKSNNCYYYHVGTTHTPASTTNLWPLRWRTLWNLFSRNIRSMQLFRVIFTVGYMWFGICVWTCLGLYVWIYGEILFQILTIFQFISMHVRIRN